MFAEMTEAAREAVVRDAAHAFRTEGDWQAAEVLEAALEAWAALVAEEGALV